MARDQTIEGVEYDFWESAEKALGVGWGDVTLELKEKSHTEWEARVFKSEGKNRREEISVTARDRASAIGNLKERCVDVIYENAFNALVKAMPYEARRALLRMCQKMLETEYAVFTASKGTSADEIASNISRGEYWEEVHRRAEEIKQMVLDGDLKDSEAVYEAVHEIEVTYTSHALEVLRHSDNDKAYWEQMGGEEPSWEALASYAKQADVTNKLGFDPEHIEEHACARCGDVVTIEEDAEECPKCGLSFEVTEDQGVDVEDAEDPNSMVESCSSCLEEHPPKVPEGETPNGPTPLAPNTEFTCHYCNGEFITPQPKPEPKTLAEVFDPIPEPPVPPGEIFRMMSDEAQQQLMAKEDQAVRGVLNKIAGGDPAEDLFNVAFSIGEHHGSMQVSATSAATARARFNDFPITVKLEALGLTTADLARVVNVESASNPEPTEE